MGSGAGDGNDVIGNRFDGTGADIQARNLISCHSYQKDLFGEIGSKILSVIILT